MVNTERSLKTILLPAGEKLVDICEFNGKLYVATTLGLFRLEGDVLFAVPLALKDVEDEPKHRP